MERRTIPEAENRLVILYALNSLGSATDMQLLQFMTEFDMMNYFTLQLGLCDMEEQGQLRQHPHPLGSLLEVTDQGLYTLRAFDHRIPSSRRVLIDREAPAWRERFRWEQQTPADAYPLPGGAMCLRLCLMEGDASLLDILLVLPEGAPLAFVQQRWHKAAHQVYGGVTETLTAGYQQSARYSAPLPASAWLQKAGHGEWFLSLETEGMTLMLSLPDEQLARCCAMAWPQEAEGLHGLVLAQLTAADAASR